MAIYRKWGTHARVFSQTLEHGKQQEWNKIKELTKKVREGREYENK